MPRKPKAIHPLRILRFALDLNQAELATRLGISEGWVNTLESEGREIPDRIKDLILAQFGIDIGRRSPLDPDDKLTFVYAAALMRAEMLAWQEEAQIANDDAVDAFDQEFSTKLRALVSAAQKHGRSIALLLSLERWVDEMLNTLGPAVRSAFKAEYPSAWRYWPTSGGSLGSPFLSEQASERLLEYTFSENRADNFEKRSNSKVPERFVKALTDAGIDMNDESIDFGTVCLEASSHFHYRDSEALVRPRYSMHDAAPEVREPDQRHLSEQPSSETRSFRPASKLKPEKAKGKGGSIAAHQSTPPEPLPGDPSAAPRPKKKSPRKAK